MTLLRERLFDRLRHLQLPAAELVVLVGAREHSIRRKKIIESGKLVLLPLNGLGGSGHARVSIILVGAILVPSPRPILQQQYSNSKSFAPEASAAPLVAVVGRPNVGKSTLFNRLVGSRRSIVGDEPGITRDRIYGDVVWNGRELRIVDTGGIIPEDKELIPAEIFRQARVAFDEAAAIIMVIDGRSELAAPDIELARLLIRTGKPIFLAVNKVDSPKLEAEAENFRRLGIKNLKPISAEHGLGVAELLEAVLEVIPPGLESAAAPDALASEELADEPAEEEDSREVKVAINGRPNVGKSTLLNQLTGT